MKEKQERNKWIRTALVGFILGVLGMLTFTSGEKWVATVVNIDGISVVNVDGNKCRVQDRKDSDGDKYTTIHCKN